MPISIDEMRILSDAGLTAEQFIVIAKIFESREKHRALPSEQARNRMRKMRASRRLEKTALRNSDATVTQRNVTVTPIPSPSPMVAPSPPLQSSPPPPLNPSPAPSPESPQAGNANLFAAVAVALPAVNRFEADFEELWVAFPKHSGSKARAKSSYKTARRKGFSHAEIIGGVAPYIIWLQRKPDGFEYVAHLATWLNQQRWLVDYVRPDAGHGGGAGRILSDGSAGGEAIDRSMRALAAAAARHGS